MSTYHHGNLRSELIATATELARRSGPDGVALREVARQAGVSHNAAYRHFSDRDALLAEVAAVAMAQLELSMRERTARIAEPDPGRRARLRLSETGRAYVDFALAEPGLFKVAFASMSTLATATAPEVTPAPERSAAAVEGWEHAGPYGVLGHVLDELVEAGQLSPQRREGAELTCWSAVHGFAALHQTGPLRAVEPEERRRALEGLLATIEHGLLDA
ncbi:TetR/AcrR family transcriptional regulator [Nocardioides sp. GY 10113]|uniref:TetR/AcrR family transcriptional regulator n=1 Tax=Nocardioides sp. GY 10113 TaxID=2569761 RepID=UPI0010A82EA1|nr:TetR/AcrR family transcriptional regulator [Nocardioides sp. GY 10113]TIC87729.1 TetR/AcrR family transcriptional regulator [Nocardioides sp. GY 10113]